MYDLLTILVYELRVMVFLSVTPNLFRLNGIMRN